MYDRLERYCFVFDFFFLVNNWVFVENFFFKVNKDYFVLINFKY